MSEVRYCRICEIQKQFSENIADYAARYIDEIREEDRASEKVYADRLEACLSCSRLSGAMCTACGCYVELRAAVQGQDCPYHLWK